MNFLDTTSPHHVPAIREHLLNEWGPGKPYRKMAVQQALGSKTYIRSPSETMEEHAMGHISVELRMLQNAALWWASAEMVDVLLAAIPAVPDDTVISDLILPSPSGLIVFERSVTGVDAEIPDQEVVVDAIGWGQSEMAPIFSRPQVEHCLSISSYRNVNAAAMEQSILDGLKASVITEEMADEMRAASKETDNHWAYLGRSDWPNTDDMNQAPFAECSEQQAISFIEDRRLVAALFTLLAQEAIAETEYVKIPRHERRRSERVGVTPEASNLRILRLRRHQRNISEKEGEPIPSGRRYSHRWVVNPFFRHQWVGPGRSQRKLVLVSGHVKGPEDKPLKIKQEVRAWVK